jgi:hypothetical protein
MYFIVDTWEYDNRFVQRVRQWRNGYLFDVNWKTIQKSSSCPSVNVMLRLFLQGKYPPHENSTYWRTSRWYELR